MRRLGPRLSSCLLVLYVLCGQVSFSSHVLRTPRGLITLPPLFIWRERRKKERKDERKVCDRLLPVALPFTRPGLALGVWVQTHTLQSSSVCACVCVCGTIVANFWWNSLDQRQIASWCHLIRSEGYCFAILGRPSSPPLWGLWRKMMSWLEPEPS